MPTEVGKIEYKLPGEPDVWPEPDVIVFAPATFNSVNSWAMGLTRDLVVGVVAEGVGKGVPMVVMPCLNAAYAQHPAFARSLGDLRTMGVDVLYGEGGFVPNEPGQDRPDEYPWHLALDAAAQRIAVPAP